MKRSNFISLLARKIEADASDCATAEDVATLCLKFVEELGMEPPAISTNATGWEIGRGTPIFINEWESEE